MKPIELEIPKLKKRELRGFDLSENEGAGLLEEHLGIRFSVMPAEIVLSGKNRILYEFRAGIVPGLLGLLLNPNKNALGFYQPEYSAYFCKDGSDVFVSLHENMHAYTSSVEPKFSESIGLLGGVLGIRMVGAIPKGDIDIEEVIVMRSTDEGLAHWGAIEVAKKLPEEFIIEEVNSTTNLLLRGQRIPDEPSPDEEFIASKIQTLKTGLQTYTEAIGLQRVALIRKFSEAESLCGNAINEIGYHFVRKKMGRLLASGSSISDGITQIIKNYPRTITELEN